jgi:hypothetical protein
MKLRTIALATAFTLTSTLALAQAPGLGGYGTVTAPSVGSYTAPVGTTNVPRTWSNTGPAAAPPTVPTPPPLPSTPPPMTRSSGAPK